MNFHELYDTWQEAPFTQPTWEAQLPALIMVLAGLTILTITVIKGDKHRTAWKVLGILGSSLTIIAGAIWSMHDIRTEPDAATELRVHVANEMSSQGVKVAPEENDGYLWQRLERDGEARVGTESGDRVLLELQGDGNALTVVQDP